MYQELRSVLEAKGLSEEMIQSILQDIDFDYYARMRNTDEPIDYAYEENQTSRMVDYQ